MSNPSRNVLRRREAKRRRILEERPCGSHKGFRRHVTGQEKPCQLCRDAEKEYQAQKVLSAIKHKDPNGWYSINRMRENPEKEQKRIEEFHSLGIDGARALGGKNYAVWKAIYAEEANQELKRRSVRRQQIHGGKRRSRIILNGFETYSPAEIFDRHGILCYLCSGAIDYTAPRQTGKLGWERGLHFDHLVPIARGGQDTLENIRPSHAICNLRKSGRLLQELPNGFFAKIVC